MTITLHGDDVAVEQAAKQLYRLIDVLKVQDVTAEPTVEHELALVKVRATDSNRAEVLKLVELSKGRVVDMADGSVIVEVTGTERRSTRSSRSSGPTASRSWSGPGPSSWPAARAPSRRQSSDDGADVLRRRRRSAALAGQTVAVIGYGSQGHAHALNLRESGRRRRRRARAGLEEPGARRGGRPAGRRRRRRRQGRRRDHDPRPRHRPEGRLRRRDRAATCAPASC